MIGGVRKMRKDRRRSIYDYIAAYIAEKGYGPSVREICDAVSLSSTATVHYHLRALAEAGLIRMENGKKRAISLSGPEAAEEAEARRQYAETQQAGRPQRLVPLLGTVAAGRPIPAVEDVEGYLPWDGGEDWFALRIRGESMKNAGILAGDKVIVRPQPTAENGEIVVALLGDEATVKRFLRREGRIWLMPENEAFEPIEGDEATILGVVRGVIREYD